ncbi:MAG: hypothetical protein AB2A00_23460 [Myxococcota bacterium]
MITHFSLTPSGKPAAVLQDVIAHATRDPAVIHVDRGHGVHWLLFCDSAATALDERARLARGETVASAVGSVVVEGNSYEVNQECSEPARARLASLVRFILKSHGPCFVHDADAQANVSAQVQQDPEILFR